jgi:MarR family transcriptional regulator, organic hydroperoxide resistance regulator
LSQLEDGVSNLGLSAAEINALACFGGEESRTGRQLVVAAAQRPSTLTGVLDRLEGWGLIERTPNPADRRSVLVRLTQSGRAVAARVPAGSPCSSAGCLTATSGASSP